jgi:hypothetical protein
MLRAPNRAGGAVLVIWVLTGLLVSLSGLILLTAGPLGLAVITVLTVVMNYITSRIVDTQLPLGVLGVLNTGLFGGWVGGWFLESAYGPKLGEIALISASLGVISARTLAEIVFSRVVKRQSRAEPN